MIILIAKFNQCQSVKKNKSQRQNITQKVIEKMQPKLKL